MKDEQAFRPQREHESLRDPSLGFEPAGVSVVRCLEHGTPWPLERWHYHDEYELQLIVESHGRAFVGDYIGHYLPGYLALVGPSLPHNWISTDSPSVNVPVRNLVIQFLDAPLRKGMDLFPEFRDLIPLFEQARQGIQFFGISESVRKRFYRIKECKGLERFAEFSELLLELTRCKDFRLLSSTPMQCNEDFSSMQRINKVLEYLYNNYAEDMSMGEVCALVDMAESSFSRYFRRATGNTFTDFLTGLRITKACQLLLQTDKLINTVCYEVGFRNIAHFNRRFLEFKGVTPTEYRRDAYPMLRFKNLTGSSEFVYRSEPTLSS